MFVIIRIWSERHVESTGFRRELVNISRILTVKVVLNASFHQNKDFVTMGHGIKVMFYDTC